MRVGQEEGRAGDDRNLKSARLYGRIHFGVYEATFAPVDSGFVD